MDIQPFKFTDRTEENLKTLKEYILMDDTFLSKIFEDPQCAALLIKIILGRTDVEVIEVSTQYAIKNLQGRSARLDILCRTVGSEFFNVEVQRSDSGAVVKRARYNSALLDSNITVTGEAYNSLKDSYVIFITENDTLKKGLPIYHVERTIVETGELVEGGSHIIYVNSKIQDNSSLGRLMHDFYCANADDMYYKEIADRVRYFKEDQEGVRIMCKQMEDLRKESLVIGVIVSCRDMGKTDKEIVDYIMQKFDLTEIEALAYMNRPAA